MMTKGEGGGQKSQKIDDVFYERPLETILRHVRFSANLPILGLMQLQLQFI